MSPAAPSPVPGVPSSPRTALAAVALAMAWLLSPPAAAPAAAQEAALESPSDSLAFALKRRRLLEDGPDARMSAILEAAEELAREGFHAEALELVYDLEDTAWSAGAAEDLLAGLPEEGEDGEGAGAPDAGPAGPPPPADGVTLTLRDLRSYVRSSVEYDTWDDNPFGGEVRAKLEWLPEGGFLERVIPTFAGSDRRAFFGLSGRGSAFGRLLKVEAEALGEKKLWQAYGDSLDRVSALALVEAGTRPLGRAVSYSLPLRAEIEQYREDRLGLSRRSLGAAPSVEAVSSDWRRSALLSYEARRFDFPSAPGSGFLRHGPYLLAHWFGAGFTAEGEAQLLDDGYDRDSSMLRSLAWDARLAGYWRPKGILHAGVRLTHEGERSRYRDTLRFATAAPDSLASERAAYRLGGSAWSVQPVVVLAWASVYSATLSLAHTRGRYPMLASQGGRDLAVRVYIAEDYRAWKPEATFSILSRRLFLNASLAYETHAPASSPHYFQRYSEGVGASGHLSWKLSPWMEVDFSGLWRERMKGAAATSAFQDVLSVSAGLVSRFH